MFSGNKGGVYNLKFYISNTDHGYILIIIQLNQSIIKKMAPIRKLSNIN